MNILLITDGLPPRVLGGTGNIVLQIARGMAQRGHTVAALSPSPAPSLTTKQDGVTLYEIPTRGNRWRHFRSVFSRRREREILRVVDAVHPDIIHAHTIATQCGYRWIRGARQRGIPVVATAHDVMNVSCGRVTGFEQVLWWKDLRRARWTWNPLRARIVRRLFNRSVRLLAVSDALRAFLERHGLAHITTIRNGIDTAFWKPMEKAAARQSLHLPGDQMIFLLAGRLGIDKGTDLVAKALPAGAHLILAGHAAVSEFAALGERLHFYENQGPDTMRVLYAAADAVLVPSRCLDCFPTVCLEAMSCSRPVLATAWGGAKEAVVDGTTGWIIDPLDEAAWRERMAWCALHRPEFERMGTAARVHVEQHFSLPRFIDRLEGIYEEEMRRACTPE